MEELTEIEVNLGTCNVSETVNFPTDEESVAEEVESLGLVLTPLEPSKTQTIIGNPEGPKIRGSIASYGVTTGAGVHLADQYEKNRLKLGDVPAPITQEKIVSWKDDVRRRSCVVCSFSMMDFAESPDIRVVVNTTSASSPVRYSCQFFICNELRAVHSYQRSGETVQQVFRLTGAHTPNQSFNLVIRLASESEDQVSLLHFESVQFRVYGPAAQD